MMRSNRSVRFVLVILTLQFFLGVIVLDAEEKLSIDIPAGEAVETLSELAVQTGLQLIYPTDLLSNVQTRDIKGRHTGQEALGLILEGTGLTSLKDKKSGAYLIKQSAPKEQILTISNQKRTRRNMKKFKLITLLAGVLAIASPPTVSGQNENNVPEAEEDLITLDPFSVVSQLDKSGYGVTSLTSLTRLNTPMRDIPQTINVVTDKLIEELVAENLGEAVSFTPGVSPRTGDPDRFSIRSIDVSSQFKNSFRFATGGSLHFRKDLTNVSRIEIIKGLGSATTGRGEAGGVVNVITKKPLPVKAQSIKATVGSWGYYKIEADSTGPLNEKGSILYRAIAAYTGGSTFMDNEDYDLFNFYPSVEFHFTDKTKLLLEGSIQAGQTPSSNFVEIQDERQFFVRGIDGSARRVTPNAGDLKIVKVMDQRTPQTASFVDPEAESYELMAVLTHRFNDWISTRQALVYFNANVDRDLTRLRGFGSYIFDPADPGGKPIDWTMALRRDFREIDTEFYSVQGDLLLDYNIGMTTHQTLIGYEYTDRSIFNRFTRAQTGGIFQIVDNTDFLNFREDGLPVATVRSFENQDVEEIGYYFQHSIKAFNDRMQVLGGWRYDDRRQEINDLRSGGSFTVADPAHTDKTYRIGGSFRLLPWLTAFGVHAEQQDPSETVFRFPAGNDGIESRDPNELLTSARGVALDEFGLKSELFGGRLTFNLSYFDITETGDLRTHNFKTNPDDELSPEFNWTENLIDPENTSEGVEIEVWGTPTERFSFYASAAFMDTALRVVDSDSSILERKQRGHTDTTIAFNGSYIIVDRDNWNVSFQNAFSWTDDVVLNPPNQFLQASSLRVDLGLKFAQFGANSGKWEAQFRVQNVLDQRITTGTGNSGTLPRRYSFYVKRSF